MAARNELYRKTMDLLDNDLDGKEDPNLEDIVQRYFQKRNSRVSKYVDNRHGCKRCLKTILRLTHANCIYS